MLVKEATDDNIRVDVLFDVSTVWCETVTLCNFLYIQGPIYMLYVSLRFGTGRCYFAWIGYDILSKMWDEITYRFPNFNGFTFFDVWEWINSFIPRYRMYVMTYRCWDCSWFIISNGAPGPITGVGQTYHGYNKDILELRVHLIYM